MKTLNFLLRAVPPFRLDYTAWALRRRPENMMDRWDGGFYQRVFVFEGAPVSVTAVQTGGVDSPALEVSARGEEKKLRPSLKEDIAAALGRVLGLQTGLKDFYGMAKKDRDLGPLAERFRGLKPPRFPTVFEGLVNAMACQQLSLLVGIRLLNRITEAWGRHFEGDGGGSAFPLPEDLAGVPQEGFRSMGYSAQKARAIRELSDRITKGLLDPEGLGPMDDESALRELLGIRGVGRWSAEYVLLRGLGRVRIFPGDDAGARKKLAMWLGVTERLDYNGVGGIVSRWSPYGGLVYFHLLLKGLESKGYINE
ncbi:MAG: hypothetical protein M0Z59_04485 [Nitrospiraceae bacterium]|nr:hypothetical protein [Nitrospiraceae bacterium]